MHNKACTEETGQYLVCESWVVYRLLMAAGGLLGTFTYTLRGGIFCNAQTGNVVLLAMALGNARWGEAAYYFIPITAYMLGAFVSELLYERMRTARLRWETALVAAEMGVIFLLGLLPDSVPFQVTQVAVNFICSMQYNTFRQANGVAVATTFCTNHIRQIGIHLAKWSKKRDSAFTRRMGNHAIMLLSFVAGGAIGVVLCHAVGGRAIWGALVPMAISLVLMLRADASSDPANRPAPHGH